MARRVFRISYFVVGVSHHEAASHGANTDSLTGKKLFYFHKITIYYFPKAGRWGFYPVREINVAPPYLRRK